jgi:hypothetical protein
MVDLLFVLKKKMCKELVKSMMVMLILLTPKIFMLITPKLKSIKKLNNNDY